MAISVRPRNRFSVPRQRPTAIRNLSDCGNTLRFRQSRSRRNGHCLPSTVLAAARTLLSPAMCGSQRIGKYHVDIDDSNQIGHVLRPTDRHWSSEKRSLRPAYRLQQDKCGNCASSHHARLHQWGFCFCNIDVWFPMLLHVCRSPNKILQNP